MELFHNKDVPNAVERLVKDPMFDSIAKFLWSDEEFQEIKANFKNINTVKEFQLNVMHSAINNILRSTSDGLSFSGIENLDPNRSNLFIANHRDILLDTAILQVLLVENGLETSEITFGDNLMKPGFVTDLCHLNRMLSVKRTGTARELYSYSKDLSEYVRETLVSNRNSVWLAQRGGRTKDGSDFTQPGLLKMLNMTGEKSLVENFNELHILPLSISFEYEPCDDLKTRETYAKFTEIEYEKGENEDMESIRKGILEPKGRIHFHFGTKIKLEESQLEENENQFNKKLAMLIDEEVFKGYKLWPTNYAAFDLLKGTSAYSNEYSSEEMDAFKKHINIKVNALSGDKELLLETMLKIYANPVLNKLLKPSSI